MNDYKSAFNAMAVDIGAIIALLGFDKYPGVDPVLRAITDLVLAKAEAQALREQVARLTNLAYVGEHQFADNTWKSRCDELREEVTALRAMVVVVPDSILPHRERSSVDPGFNEALRQVARLNGKAVSEGLLRRVITPALTSSDAQDRIDAQEELRDLLDQGNMVQGKVDAMDGERG